MKSVPKFRARPVAASRGSGRSRNPLLLHCILVRDRGPPPFQDIFDGGAPSQGGSIVGKDRGGEVSDSLKSAKVRVGSPPPATQGEKRETLGDGILEDWYFLPGFSRKVRRTFRCLEFRMHLVPRCGTIPLPFFSQSFAHILDGACSSSRLGNGGDALLGGCQGPNPLFLF